MPWGTPDSALSALDRLRRLGGNQGDINEDILRAIEELQNTILGPGHIAGLVPSNGSDATNDLDFSAGQAIDSIGSNLIIADSAFTKRAEVTWARGTGNGGMASGESFGADTWHCFLLGKADNPSAFDFGFDTSLTAANLMADAAVVAAGFNIFRRAGGFPTAGAAWTAFVATEIGGGGLHISWKVPIEDVQDLTDPGTSAHIVPISVPLGIKSMAMIEVTIREITPVGSMYVYVSDPDLTDSGPNAENPPGISLTKPAAEVYGSGQVIVMTDASSQIRYRVAGSNADTDFYLFTQGFEDFRR